MALLLAGCGDGAALDRLAGGGRGRVVEVPAGDQVVLDDGERVKLAGLASLGAGDPYADEARAALAALVLGKEVELLTGGAARDPFGRKTAHLRVGRTWVQGEMLTAGAGRVRTFPDQRALGREMLEREAKARIAGRGLWATSAHPVLLPWEARRTRGFQIVEGRVDAVRRLGSDRELDLQGLPVEIPGHAAADFEAAGKPIPALAGQLVRVRGAIRSGVLRLDHPEALELLESKTPGA